MDNLQISRSRGISGFGNLSGDSNPQREDQTSGHDNKTRTDNPYRYALVNEVDMGAGSAESRRHLLDQADNTDSRHTSLTSIAIDFNAIEGVTRLNLPVVQTRASVSVLKVAASEQLSTTHSSLEAHAGIELAVIDTSAALAVHINPKAIVDTAAHVYNRYVDPLLDRVTGIDVPPLPDAPESWDHTLSLSAELNAGWGLAAKAQGAAHVDPQGWAFSLGGRISPSGVGMIVGGDIGIALE